MKRILHNKQNDLTEKVRLGVIELLNQQLADALDLGLQAKQAHWNVKGPNFIALHELFDEVVDELTEIHRRNRRASGRTWRHSPWHGSGGSSAIALARIPVEHQFRS